MRGAIPAIGKRLPIREVRPAILGGVLGSCDAISTGAFGDLHCFLLRLLTGTLTGLLTGEMWVCLPDAYRDPHDHYATTLSL